MHPALIAATHPGAPLWSGLCLVELDRAAQQAVAMCKRPHRKRVHKGLCEVKGEELIGDAQQHRSQFPLAFSSHSSVRLHRQMLSSEQADLHSSRLRLTLLQAGPSAAPHLGCTMGLSRCSWAPAARNLSALWQMACLATVHAVSWM